ncbi:MAG TPA: hypothetical protein VFO75_03655, partial [Candidatus Dormibacteraeota bacterium]|nr:hypothetical protein [Candidatus Dormibacteraeota bacterium]
ALLVSTATATSADSSQLSSWLAPAPGSDWVEAAPTPTTLEGPFSSQSYSNFLQTTSPTTPSVTDQLNALAFREGYARTWVQGSTNDQLTERVFRFGDVLGASAWYANLKAQNQQTKYMTRVIPPLEGNANSFGVVLKTPNYTSYRVEFLVSSLVFTVHMDSATNDLTDLAVSQALAELRAQAAATRHSAVAEPASPKLPVAEIVTAGVVAGLAAVVVAWLVRRRRKPV